MKKSIKKRYFTLSTQLY